MNQNLRELELAHVRRLAEAIQHQLDVASVQDEHLNRACNDLIVRTAALEG